MNFDAQLSELGFDDTTVTRLRHLANPVQLKAGTIVFRPGEACKHYILPLSGAIDVVMLGANGRQMRLYDVRAGQICIQTFSGLATGAPYSGEGTVVKDMEALMLSDTQFHALMGESAPFRNFVLKTVSQRFVELSQSILNLASVPVAQRLAQWLLDRAEKGQIETTQAALAVDISSAREVVSRTLNLWSKDNILRMKRGRIEIIDAPKLRQIAVKDLSAQD